MSAPTRTVKSRVERTVRVAVLVVVGDRARMVRVLRWAVGR